MDTTPAPSDAGGDPRTGTQTPRGWRPGRDGLLRPLIFRATLGFWTAREADLWVNQRMLVTHVRRSLRRVDKDTVRSALDEMGRGGMLVCRRLGERRTVYRLSPRFADPTAPGYAREVDALLLDPLPWVTADGRFYRLGREDGRAAAALPVASPPHHFAKHAWMRSWIRACAAGLFSDPETALERATVAARAAPVEFLEQWAAGQGSRVRIPERPEAAVLLLHRLCGHHHLAPILGPDVLEGPSEAPLRELEAYLGMDRAIARRLPGAQSAPSDLDRLLPAVEPRLRAMPPPLQATLCDHRRAWPGGLFGARPLPGQVTDFSD